MKSILTMQELQDVFTFGMDDAKDGIDYKKCPFISRVCRAVWEAGHDSYTVNQQGGKGITFAEFTPVIEAMLNCT